MQFGRQGKSSNVKEDLDEVWAKLAELDMHDKEENKSNRKEHAQRSIVQVFEQQNDDRLVEAYR
jgi:flagellar motility protein MotE (MotC chaperone)